MSDLMRVCTKRTRLSETNVLIVTIYFIIERGTPSEDAPLPNLIVMHRNEIKNVRNILRKWA